MNQADFRANTPYAEFGNVVAAAPEEARRTFIRKTYTHLAAAIYAFVMLEWVFVQLGCDQKALRADRARAASCGWPSWAVSWLISWVADSWAQSATSIGKQYAGLFLYVLGRGRHFPADDRHRQVHDHESLPVKNSHHRCRRYYDGRNGCRADRLRISSPSKTFPSWAAFSAWSAWARWL